MLPSCNFIIDLAFKDIIPSRCYLHLMGLLKSDQVFEDIIVLRLLQFATFMIVKEKWQQVLLVLKLL